MLSPDNKILLSVDVDGFALIINFEKQVINSRFNFKAPVTACCFSPDSKFFAVATEVFFGRPTELLVDEPELYAELRAFYGQDPAARLQRCASRTSPSPSS